MNTITRSRPKANPQDPDVLLTAAIAAGKCDPQAAEIANWLLRARQLPQAGVKDLLLRRAKNRIGGRK